MSHPDVLATVVSVAENLAFLMPVGPAEAAPAGWAVQVAVPWRGPDGTGGRIVLALDEGAAQATAANLLGLMPGEPAPTEDVGEAARELGNVVAGNLLAALYGDHHDFHLEPPQEVVNQEMSGRTVLIALMEGVLGVAIQAESDNTRILKAVRLPPGERR